MPMCRFTPIAAARRCYAGAQCCARCRLPQDALRVADMMTRAAHLPPLMPVTLRADILRATPLIYACHYAIADAAIIFFAMMPPPFRYAIIAFEPPFHYFCRR